MEPYAMEGSLHYMPGDLHLVEQIVYELKSKGIFDQFRKECIADVDTKPAYQNLRQRVEGSVSSFLNRQRWKPDMNKNQLREKLRKQIQDANYLDQGVERIVDQVVNPKVASVFIPKVEDLVYSYLGIPRPKREEEAENKVGEETENMLHTESGVVSPGSVKSLGDNKENEMKTSLDIEMKNGHFDSIIEVSDSEDSFINKIKDIEDIPLPRSMESSKSPENLSMDIPLPTDTDPQTIPLPKDEGTTTNDINIDGDSSSDSVILRNMSPLTPVRSYNNENSCDAQQAFESNNSDKESIKETSFNFNKEQNKFKFDINQPDSINDDSKMDENSTESRGIEIQTNLTYQFQQQVQVTGFHGQYEESSGSNNLKIDYHSDHNNDSVIGVDDKSSKLSLTCDIPLPKGEPKNDRFENKHRSSRDSQRRSHSSRHKDDRSHSKHHSSSRDSEKKDGKENDKKTEKKSSSSSKHESSRSEHKKSSRGKSREGSEKRADTSRDKHQSSSYNKDSKSSHSRHHSSSSRKHSSSSHKKSDEKKSSTSSEKKSESKDSKEHRSSSKSSSRDHSRHSSSHRSESKSKSDSKTSSHKTKENEKKKDKKETDDHYSSSGRNQRTRRSTDRDSNDGNSSSSKHSQSTNNNNKSFSLAKDNTKSSSKSETQSSNTDSSGPSDKVGIAVAKNNDEIDLQMKRMEKELQAMMDPEVYEISIETSSESIDSSDPDPNHSRDGEDNCKPKELDKFKKNHESEEDTRLQAAAMMEIQQNFHSSANQVFPDISGPELEFACMPSKNDLQDLNREVSQERQDLSEAGLQINDEDVIITVDINKKKFRGFTNVDQQKALSKSDYYKNFFDNFQSKCNIKPKLNMINCDLDTEKILSSLTKQDIFNYTKNGRPIKIKKITPTDREIMLPYKSPEYSFMSPSKSDCSLESEYVLELNDMVSNTSRQQIMEIILGGEMSECSSKMLTIDYCDVSSLENPENTNNLKRRRSSSEEGNVLIPSKERKTSLSEQITSTTEDDQPVVVSKFFGKARRVGLPKLKNKLKKSPKSPVSDQSVENYEQNIQGSSVMSAPAKLKNRKTKLEIQRYNTSDLYKPKLHFLSRRNNNVSS